MEVDTVSGAKLLADGFERVRTIVDAVLDGLSIDELGFRLSDRANSIGWLVWHLTRVQDDHVSAAAEVDQAWIADGWQDRFGLPFDPAATGYGQTGEEVASVRVSANLLRAYLDAVTERTISYVLSLDDGDFDRVVDPNWDPPVILGVRLVSVLSDDLQHAGQAALVRGVLPVEQLTGPSPQSH